MTTEGGGGGGDGVGGTRPISVPLITLMLFSSDSDGASPPCDPLSYSHMKKKKIEGCTKAEKRARVAASLFSSSLYTQAGAQMRCFHSAASLLYPHESHPPLGGVTSPAPAYLLLSRAPEPLHLLLTPSSSMSLQQDDDDGEAGRRRTDNKTI